MPGLPELDRDPLVVEIEGTEFSSGDKILSYRISSNYTTPTDAWEFTVYSEDDPKALRRRWRPFQPVKLMIAGRQQILGRIDGNSGVGDSGRMLKVFGRDYLSDIVDSSIDPTFQVKKGQDIGAIVLDVLKPWGITTVLGGSALNRNALTGKQPFKPVPKNLAEIKLEDFKAEENEGAFEFLNKILARHGLTLQPSSTRDTVIVDSPRYEQAALYKLSFPGNMVKASNATRDYSGVPTVTIARGRTGGSDAGKQSGSGRTEYPTFDKSGPSKIGGVLDAQRAITSDDNVIIVREKRFDPKKPDRTTYGYDFPVYKPLFYQDKASRNQAQLDASVRRMMAEKIRNTLTYPFTVRGHVDPTSDALWSVDTIVTVQDDIEDVNEDLWIVERTLSNDGSGPMTEGVAVRPDSYVY
jgi:prophage tail gpP-like protein